MIQNQSAFCVCHETVKSHREEKRNEHDFREQFFSQNFETLEKL